MKIIRTIIAILLLFNGVGALYGGFNLMRYPDGSSIELSIQWLKHTPFQNYFIPGLVLFIFNGVLSILVLVSILTKHIYSPLLVITQGVILVGWIIIQMLLIQTVYFLHYIMGSTGLALIALGLWQYRLSQNKKLEAKKDLYSRLS